MRATTSATVIDQFGTTIREGVPLRIDIQDEVRWWDDDQEYVLTVESAVFRGGVLNAVVDYPPPKRRGWISRLLG